MLAFVGRDIAGSLELLDGNVRVFGEEDHIPIVVAHGRRATATMVIQKSKKQSAAGPREQ